MTGTLLGNFLMQDQLCSLRLASLVLPLKQDSTCLALNIHYYQLMSCPNILKPISNLPEGKPELEVAVLCLDCRSLALFKDGMLLRGGEQLLLVSTQLCVRAQFVREEGGKLVLRLDYEQIQFLEIQILKEEDFSSLYLLLKRRLFLRGFKELFKPVRKLGSGTYANVYVAERNSDGQQVSVKAFLKQSVKSQERGWQMLMNQISILRQLDHPNIMKNLEIYQSSNSIYVVNQLLRGGQLLMRDKLMYYSKIAVKRILTQLLRALLELQRQDVVHRDLKPQNILFRDKERKEVVIADFGLSTRLFKEKPVFQKCGTPGFIAPQVLRKSPVMLSIKSDIFSLGVVLHFLLIKRPVFNCKVKDHQQIIQLNKQANISFQGPQYSSLSASQLDLLKGMLQKQPEKRFSPAECLQSKWLQGDQQAKPCSDSKGQTAN